MVAPFILAYQPEGADWTDPTFADFWTGLPLVMISVVGLVAFFRTLIDDLDDRGILERGIPTGYPLAQGHVRRGGAMNRREHHFAKMLKDMQEQRKLEGGESSWGLREAYPLRDESTDQSERRA